MFVECSSACGSSKVSSLGLFHYGLFFRQGLVRYQLCKVVVYLCQVVGVECHHHSSSSSMICLVLFE